MRRSLLFWVFLCLAGGQAFAQQRTAPPLPTEGKPAPTPTPPSATANVAPPAVPARPNGPIQRSLVRITATDVEPDYKAPWNSGSIQRGVGAGFVIEGKR